MEKKCVKSRMCEHNRVLIVLQQQKIKCIIIITNNFQERNSFIHDLRNDFLSCLNLALKKQFMHDRKLSIRAQWSIHMWTLMRIRDENGKFLERKINRIIRNRFKCVGRFQIVYVIVIDEYWCEK